MDLFQQSLKNTSQTASAPNIPIWFSSVPLKPFQMLVLKNEMKHVEPILAAISVMSRELIHNCVCRSVHWGLLFSGDCDARSAWYHILQLVPQTHHSLSSRDMEQVLTLVSVSHTLNLQLRFYQRNHSDLLQQDFLNQQRGRIWAVLHISWWNAIWWYRELNTVILNLTATRDCFPFLTSRF